jgi:hypothetical protein
VKKRSSWSVEGGGRSQLRGGGMGRHVRCGGNLVRGGGTRGGEEIEEEDGGACSWRATKLAARQTTGARDASASASTRHRPHERDDGAPPQREHPHDGALLGSTPPISSPMREMNTTAASAPHI